MNAQEISYLPISHSKFKEFQQYFQQKEENIKHNAQSNQKAVKTNVQQKFAIIGSTEYKQKFQQLVEEYPYPHYDPQGDKKILFLDMDQTLIHSQKQGQIGFYDHKFDLYVNSQKISITFNVRPHCAEFLISAAQDYDIVVYTAATYQYAQKMINFLNTISRNSIKAFHPRDKCIKMVNGRVYKDPRIFKKVSPRDYMIIDDNLECMLPVIDNGILVKPFIDDRHDQQLLNLLKIVKRAIRYDDLRYFLAKKL